MSTQRVRSMIDLEQSALLAAPHSRQQQQQQQQKQQPSACAYPSLNRFAASSAPVRNQYLSADTYRMPGGYAGYGRPESREGVAASSCSSQSSAGGTLQIARSPTAESITPSSLPSPKVRVLCHSLRAGAMPCALCGWYVRRSVQMLPCSVHPSRSHAVSIVGLFLFRLISAPWEAHCR